MRNNRNIFIGVLFIIFGIFYLGGLLNFWPFINIWSTGWIVITFVLGVFLILSRNFVGGFVLFGFSLSRIINYLPYPYSSMFQISTWNIIVIALLFGIGFQIIFKGSHKNKHYRKYEKRYEYYDNSNTWDSDTFDGESRVVDDETDTRQNFQGSNGVDEIFVDASFNEVNRYVQSQNFIGGEVNCSFGSATVHLTQANLNEAGAHLNLNCSFGAIKVYVPRTWAVNNKMNSTIFASVNDDRAGVVDGTLPNLSITGNVNFGEVEIIYV